MNNNLEIVQVWNGEIFTLEFKRNMSKIYSMGQ